MSLAAVQQRFEDLLRGIQQPARLIGQEFGAGPGFGECPSELRIVLGFPDTYEIGISNQAIQILYYLASGIDGVAVERVYLPWVDAIAEMRRVGIPLLTIETWSPVIEADLLGVTLQHEFNYSNLLEMLNLAGIPLRAEDRTASHPLVLAGGPAVANFLPLSAFLDAVAVGDGEEIFPEVLRVLARVKHSGASRTEAKRALAAVEGVYVPGVSRTVSRRILPHLEGAPYPTSCLVPLTAGVHDRAWIEVMRGCTRGCRFCQAGLWYRPVRERSPGEVAAMAAAQLAASGHQELAFASLSTTDYSELERLLAETVRSHPEVRVSLPSLRVDSAAVRLAHLVSPTGPSLTLAPEAGSQRMRDIINKNITENDILAAAEEAFRAGRTTLKLYFLIGLPFEEDVDVVAIADLCWRVRDLGRRMLGPRAGRLKLNVSVNNFVPKPFTPFQWAGMADRQTLVRRQDLLRARLRGSGLSLALHRVETSYLEAALARGSEAIGDVVEEAWRRGARFDSWTEQFRSDAWRAAFAVTGTTTESLATATIAQNTPLPWDLIGGVVDRGFLWKEWERAEQGVSTGDCRWDGCSCCGACPGVPGNDLAGARKDGAKTSAEKRPPGAATGMEMFETFGPTGGSTQRWRYILSFSVTGRGRFIGHLDRAEILRRAVRRAGGRLSLSAGLRPKALLSLALPLAVGTESLHELGEFELAEAPAPDFFERLKTAVPIHMRLQSLTPYDELRSLASRVVGAEYEVEVSEANVTSGVASGEDALLSAVESFTDIPELLLEEEREGRVRRIDVKAYVDTIRVERTNEEIYTLRFQARVTPTGTARPERVVEAVQQLSGLELAIKKITRTCIMVR